MMDPNVNEVMIAAREKATQAMAGEGGNGDIPTEMVHAMLVTMYCEAYRDALQYAGELVQKRADACASRMPPGETL